MRVYFHRTASLLMCLVVCMLVCSAAFSSVSMCKGRDMLFVEEKGQNANPEYLKFSWKGNRLFAYFCTDKVTFVTQEVSYVDNEASMDARRKGNVNEAMKLSAVTEVHSFDMKFLNSSSDVKVSGLDEQEATFDYYLENCPQGILGAKSYSKILYSNIYPNIDLEFYIDGNRIKYDFVVRSGGSASDIKIEWDGVDNLDLTNEGISFNVGSFLFVDMLPVSFCGDEEVETKYIVEENTVKFSVDNYNAANTLVIDPGITWSSHLEYNGYGTWGDIVHNSDGNYFYYADWEWGPTAADVSNYLSSASSNNHYGTAGGRDIIISKFKFSGDLVWVCQYGGDSNDDIDGAVMYDEQNERLYVAGNTNSSGFPLQNRSGAYNLTWSNATNGSNTFTTSGTRGFLLMFDANNSRQWATLLDRGINLETYDMAVNSSGSVYLIGKMGSVSYRDYTRYGNQLAQIPYGSGYQGNFVYGSSESQSYSYSYIIEFASSGAMLWSTYLPVQNLVTGPYDSNTSGRVCDIEIGADGSLYIVGDELWSGDKYRFSTALISATYTNRGQDDMFYMKFNSSNQPVPAWGGYIGGAGFDKINVGAANGDIELDSQNRLYVTGHTYSADFPHVSPPDDCGYYRDVISGSVTNNVSGTQDGYIFRINTNTNGTSTIDYSTYFGGDGYTAMKRIYKDLADNLWICGEQNASAMAAIPVDGYYNAGFSGTQSTFFAQLSQYNEFIWLSYYGPSTYYGGFETYSPDADHINLYYAGNTQNHTNVGGGYQYSYSGSGSCTRAMVIQHDIISGVEPQIVVPAGMDCNVSSLTVSGALPSGASWHWYTGSCGGTEITTGLSGTNNETLSISSYPAGTTFYVKAEGQCLVSSCAEYTKTESMSISNIAFANPTCSGSCDGSVTVTIEGGTAPYTYNWSTSETETTDQTTAQITDLCAGAYSVTVSDASGCQSGGARETTTECFRITDILFNSCDGTAEGYNEMVTLLIGPNDLNANNMNIVWPTSGVSFTGFCQNQTIVDGINASIIGGGHVIAPTNGILPANSEVLIVTSTRFDYGSFDFSGLDHDVYILFQCNTTVETGHFGNSINNTRNFSVSFTSPSCSSQVSYTPQTNLEGDAVHYDADGTAEYYNNGCQAPVFYDEIILTAPDEVTLSYPSISGYENIDIAPVSPTTSCSGTATYSASGLPDGLSINASTGVISGTPTAQTSGNITVTISCGGCDATSNVAYNFGEEPTLDGCIIEEDFSELTAGTIANPSGTDLTQGTISDFPTTSKAYSAGGTVKLGSSSASGYIQTAALNLSVPFYVEFDVKGWTSVEGNIIVTVSGVQSQTVSYTATRNDDFETKHIDFNAATASSTVRIATSAKRAYIDNVRVCYPSSCTMTASASQTSGLCSGNIVIEAEATDATGTLSYVWDNGAGTGEQYANAVSGTTYMVTVSDEAGCSATASVTPVQYGSPQITPSYDAILCHGGTTNIVLNVSGGYGAPYTYQWEGSSNTTNTLSDVEAGTYNVTVSDANCSATSSIQVSEPEAITFSVTSTAQVCNTLGTATVSNVQGGNGTYNYLWSNSSDEASVEVASGVYNVIVSDGNGCSASATVSVGSNPTSVSFTATPSNPNCYGETGSIAVTNIVGAANYSVAWTGGSQSGISANSYTIPNLGDNTYSVTVTDANGCSATQNGLSVFVPDEITFDILTTPEVCATLGTATVSNEQGGNGTYNYLWSNSSDEASVEVASGVYNVIVSDGNGCSASATVSVGSNPTSVSFTATPSNPNCYGETGSIAVTNIVGAANYSVAWTGGSQSGISANNYTIPNIGDNTYSVTVTDANGCSATQNGIEIEVPEDITFTVSQVEPVCATPGSIVLENVAGGNGGYSYVWHNSSGEVVGTDSNVLSGINAGVYSVTITDANNCEKTETITLNASGGSVSYSLDPQRLLCYADASGKINVQNITGTAPYSVSWSGDANGSHSGVTGNSYEITGLPAGSYTIVVSDADMCSSTMTTTVSQPDSLYATASLTAPIMCHGDSFGISSEAEGGTANYSYRWNNNVNTQTQSGLTQYGPYIVTVSDNNGCEATASVNVVEPAELHITVEAGSILCNGQTTTVTVSGSGGTGSYNGVGEFTNISANTNAYTYTITDENNCSASDQILVTEPEVLSVSLSNVIAQTCQTLGSVDLSISGGYGSISYSWDGGASNTYTSAVSESLASGSHTIVVSDANGCEISQFVVVPNNAGMTASLLSQSPARCYGMGGGSFEIGISNGIPPYTITWDNGTLTEQESSHVFSDLTYGAYSVTVVDANGCVGNVAVQIGQPSALEVSAQVTSVINCHNDTFDISASASGGNGGYSYSWGGNVVGQSQTGLADYTEYFVTVTDAKGCVATSSVTPQNPQQIQIVGFDGAEIECHDETAVVVANAVGGTGELTYTWATTGVSSVVSQQITAPAGTYQLTVSDVNGCSVTTELVIENPEPISVSTVTITPQYCTSMGEVNLSVGGGTGALSYSWNGGASNAVSGNAIISQFAAGDYTLVVTDANGCSATREVTIGVGAAMSISTEAFAVRCNGDANGRLVLSMENGTAPYSILWNSETITENNTIHQFVNLNSGSYSVTVTDANGCIGSTAVFIGTPEPLVASAEVGQVQCHGDVAVVEVSATGGSPQYQNVGVYNLSAGEYNYIVTDANGCQSPVHVSVAEPSAISVSTVATDAPCYGQNGSAMLEISGGVSPYNVVWQDNSTGAVNTQVPVNTVFGYVVSDANGCLYNGTVRVGEPEPILLSLSADVVSCFGLSDGTVSVVSLSGGTLPYEYRWSNGSASPMLTGVGAGRYTLTVTDASGCSESATAIVSQPDEFLVGVISTNVECGVSDGSLLASARGGNGSYSYVWSNGMTGEHLTHVFAGEYSLTATDAKGCWVTASARVDVVGMLTASIEELSPVSCFGMSDASLVAVSEQAQPPVVYQWSTGQMASELYGIGMGQYMLTVTDAWGCVGMANHLVVSPTAITMTSQVTDSKCYNSSDGAITVWVDGGMQPYTFAWSNGSTDQNVSGLTTGVYNLLVTDSAGCMLQQEFHVNAPQRIAISADVKNVSCHGNRDGRISINAVGGVEPYEYGFVFGSSVVHGISVYDRLHSGVYQVSVEDANGCGESLSVSVMQPEKLDVDVIVTAPSCKDFNDGSILISTVGGTEPYRFEMGGYSSDSSLYAGLRAGVYNVYVTDANGCMTNYSDIMVPESKIDCIHIPNVITPNGDGVNDEWIIENIEMFPEAHIYVYNRWGQLLYHERGNGERWDGRYRGHFVPAGVYMYIIKLESIEESYTGTVSVLY